MIHDTNVSCSLHRTSVVVAVQAGPEPTLHGAYGIPIQSHVPRALDGVTPPTPAWSRALCSTTTTAATTAATGTAEGIFGDQDEFIS
jgi:hypothetical protein